MLAYYGEKGCVGIWKGFVYNVRRMMNMRVENIKAYCLDKWKAYEDYPFGEIPVCYKLNGKIFAQIYPNQEDYKITLKCTADAGQFYRQVYPEVVVRGYHCPPVQQPYWNTIYLENFSDEELLNMIDHAYDTVLRSFSKKVQKQILTADKIEIRSIRQEEYPLLEDFLYDAIYIPEGMVPPPKSIIGQPELAVYIDNFGQPDDLCLIVESEGHILGAVWTRILAGKIRGYGNIDEHTPEFAISVKKEFRQQGIGSRLMKEMIALLKCKGYERASLSVNKDNYACRMYQKLGFQMVPKGHIIIDQDEDYLMILELR